MGEELVLVLSDILIPLKSPSIDSQFKSILLPNKINHLLCLGNIGNQDTLYWLQSLSPDVHIIKGDYDIYQNYPEKKVIQIGSFRLGMIHGHQILPPGNMDALSGIQSELDCDILLSGFTYKYGINIKENKLFMNPGSITGGLSPLMEDTYPSFILMAITDDEMTIYSYMLTDKNEKFQVGQMEYKKGSNEIKVVQEIKLEWKKKIKALEEQGYKYRKRIIKTKFININLVLIILFLFNCSVLKSSFLLLFSFSLVPEMSIKLKSDKKELAFNISIFEYMLEMSLDKVLLRELFELSDKKKKIDIFFW